MITIKSVISFFQGIVHHYQSCLFRVIANVSFRVFEIRVEVHFVIGVCREQEYHFIGVFHDNPVISNFQCSPFMDSLDSDSKFHSVIIENSGIN